jgi:hypothetical protein
VTDDYSERIEGLAELRRTMEAQRHRRVPSGPPEKPREEAPATPR